VQKKPKSSCQNRAGQALPTLGFEFSLKVTSALVDAFHKLFHVPAQRNKIKSKSQKDVMTFAVIRKLSRKVTCHKTK
jgi:hypothetical protein